MSYHPVPACLQIGGANHSSAPSTAPQSRSATPNNTHHITPATTANDDEEGPGQTRNPYCSATLERSINAWLDKMVDVKCQPFNPHAESIHGWEGLPPYSEEDDEGRHGWDKSKNAAMSVGKKRQGKGVEMGDIMVGLEMQLDGVNQENGDLGNRDVKRGYEEWMESVGRETGFKKLGKRY